MQPLGIEFQETSSQAAATIELVWENQSGTLNGGFWDSPVRKLRFDSSMNWYFAVNPNEGQPGGIQNDQWHFLSVALHESGHVVGLAHGADTTDVMTTTVGQPPNVPGHRYFTALDEDSIEGVRDLYSQSHAPPPPPQVASCEAYFLGCPPGCAESPYMMSWSAPNATEFEVQHWGYGIWSPFMSGPNTATNFSTGTEYTEFFRVRGVNESGVGPWCSMYLQVQCSDTQDPY